MEPLATTHPADETLVSYGLGKLDDTLAESVGKHLEGCDPCRRRVAELSSDSFLGRLQSVKPTKRSPSLDSNAVRPMTLVEDVPASSREKVSEQAAVPAELVYHPQYEVVRELGRGGMGVVYLARNRLMDRLEVLKVLSKELLAKEGRADRFLREIQSAAKLHHPNVVAAHAAFPAGELLVFAMEYVEGEDLGKLIRSRGPLPVLNACYFAYQAAQGLQHAHERGMIHRDIKPGNLILLREGKKATVKILDFGLAKVRSEQRLDRTLTQAGQMLGTPDYIAPEQTLDAQKADIRADIYSLGCTLYHLLTGHPPFSGNSLYEVLQAHHSVEAKALNLVRPEVPAEVAAVVAKMMAKEADRRYQTPAEVAQALKPFLKPGGLSSPPVEISQVGAKKPKPSKAGPSEQNAEDEAAPSFAPMEAMEPAERWKSLLDLPAMERSSAVRKVIGPAKRRQMPWKWPAIATGVLLVALGVLWAGSLIIHTKDGAIVLKNLPDDANVFVDGERVLVTRKTGKLAEISVAPGEHQLEVKIGELIAHGERVTIASGTPREIDAEYRPTQPGRREGVSSDEKRENGGTARTPTVVPPARPQPLSPELLVAPFDETTAKKRQQEWAQYLHLEIETPNTIGMKLVLIPPGRFQMGSPETMEQLKAAFPIEAASNVPGLRPYGERPVHEVTITKPFLLGKYEVTKREFQQFVDDAGYRTDVEVNGKSGTGFALKGEKFGSIGGTNWTWRNWTPELPDDTPVVNISHNDASKFCEWLSKKERTTYRLPTEAEWEYACRAGTVTRYYNGDDPEAVTKIGNLRDATWAEKSTEDPAQAAVHSSDGYALVSPVGQFRPNHFGLYDMLGNAWEACADWYSENYYITSPDRDPTGPPSGTQVVCRGGGWRTGALQCRAAKRMAASTDLTFAQSGFRVALSIPEAAGSSAPQNEQHSSGTASSPSRDEGFVPLFNGKNLTGWNKSHSETIDWQIVDSALVGINHGGNGTGGALTTERADFADFHFRCEAMLSEGLNGLVGFRRDSSDLQDGAKRQYNVLIRGTNQSTFPDLDDNPQQRTGTLMMGFAGKEPEVLREATERPLQHGKWFKLEIIAQGNRIGVMINGATVVDYVDSANTFSTGSIALTCRMASKVRFRNIEIKDLSPGHANQTMASPAEGLAARQPDAGGQFVSLFNGRDLSGWSFPYNDRDKFTVEDGMLHGCGGLTRMVSNRSDYKDFRLRVEFKSADQRNKFLIIRANHAAGDVKYYSVALGGMNNAGTIAPPGMHSFKTGGVMFAGERLTTDGLTNLEFVDTPVPAPGTWHTAELKALGNTFALSLDGKQVVVFRDDQSRLGQGQIIIGLGKDACADIRKIDIEEIVAPDGGGLHGRSAGGAGAGVEKSVDYSFGPPSSEKFVRLFNGSDFTNWMFPKGRQEKWSIEGGILRGDGTSHIATERSDFRDFHLRMQLRTPDQINKHLIFRSRDLNGIDSSYRFHLGGIRWDHKSTWALGSFSAITRTLERGEREPTDGLVTLDSVNLPLLDDKWHEVEIIAIKNVFRMILDGRQVSTFRDTLSRLPDGRIMVALVNGAHLELRDIEINEKLAKPPAASQSKSHRELRKRATAKDAFQGGTVWKGSRTYRKGFWQGVTVDYEIRVLNRHGAKFTGLKFDNGEGRNRLPVDGEIHGQSIVWREGTEWRMVGTLDGDTIAIEFNADFGNGRTEGDGQLKRVE